eukprot:1906850-Amphidinium_carterae.1
MACLVSRSGTEPATRVAVWDLEKSVDKDIAIKSIKRPAPMTRSTRLASSARQGRTACCDNQVAFTPQLDRTRSGLPSEPKT